MEPGLRLAGEDSGLIVNLDTREVDVQSGVEYAEIDLLNFHLGAAIAVGLRKGSGRDDGVELGASVDVIKVYIKFKSNVMVVW